MAPEGVEGAREVGLGRLHVLILGKTAPEGVMGIT
jgi:hypothetical protein